MGGRGDKGTENERQSVAKGRFTGLEPKPQQQNTGADMELHVVATEPSMSNVDVSRCSIPTWTAWLVEQDEKKGKAKGARRINGVFSSRKRQVPCRDSRFRKVFQPHRILRL